MAKIEPKMVKIPFLEIGKYSEKRPFWYNAAEKHSDVPTKCPEQFVT